MQALNRSLLPFTLVATLTWGGTGHKRPSRLIQPAPPQPIPGWQLMRISRQNMQPFLNAMEAYNTDNNSYPPVDTLDEALAALVPFYLPADYSPTDGWGRRFSFATLRASPGGGILNYRLASAGEGGIWSYPSAWLYQPSWMTSPTEDLVMERGGQLTRFDDPDESDHDRYFRTAGWLHVLRSVLESYNTDFNGYPTADSLEEMVSRVVPDYLGGVGPGGFPSLDEWRHLLKYEAWSSSGGAYNDHYCIGSAASDRIWEHPSLRDYGYRDVLSYQDDMILCDGAWLQLVDDPELTPLQRYKISMGAIKTLASALESYNTDANSYPPDATVDQMLARLISGGYINGAPARLRLDGWRFLMRYQPINCTGQVCPTYRLASAAADSQWEYPDLTPYVQGDNTTLAQDIIMENGQFIRACASECPAGTPPSGRPAVKHAPQATR